MIFGKIHMVKQQTKIDEPLVQLLADIGAIPAGNMKVYIGILLLEPACGFGEKMDPHCLPRSNINVPGQKLIPLG